MEIRPDGAKEPPTVAEEFFISRTLEFDWVRNHQRDNVPYLESLLQAVEMYLSGKADEAMAKVFSAATMQGKQLE